MGVNHVTKPIERFTCNIRHNDSYYKVDVKIEYHLIPDDEGYGMIKITEASYDNAKILTLEPKNLDLWVPFNNNLIFVNETDYKVRVTMFYNDKDNGYDIWVFRPCCINILHIALQHRGEYSSQ